MFQLNIERGRKKKIKEEEEIFHLKTMMKEILKVKKSATVTVASVRQDPNKKEEVAQRNSLN